MKITLYHFLYEKIDIVNLLKNLKYIAPKFKVSIIGLIFNLFESKNKYKFEF